MTGVHGYEVGSGMETLCHDVHMGPMQQATQDRTQESILGNSLA